MTDDQKRDESADSTLKQALERVVSDPKFSERFGRAPLEVLDELGVKLDADMRSALEGKRFVEFWAAWREKVEGPLEVRDLPPDSSALSDKQLDTVAGGGDNIRGPRIRHGCSPPYVPCNPATCRPR